MYSGRKSRRFKIAAPALIHDVDGDEVMACTVRDISKTGAGLELNQAVQLPRSFSLALTRDGNVRRSCELVWQRALVAGVRFSDAEAVESAGRGQKTRSLSSQVDGT